MKRIDLKKTVILLVIISTTFVGYCQNVTILGSTSANVNDVITYTAYPSQGVTVTKSAWSVTGGTIQSKTLTTATIKWTSIGQGTVNYFIILSNVGDMEASLNVTVTAVQWPITPANPTILSENCTSAVLQKTGTVPTGEEWYWQGTNSNGTSTSLNATTNYAVTTTGTYYIRSKNTSSGLWSASSGFKLVTLGDTGCPPVIGLSNENYIYTITPQIPVTDISGLTENKHAIKNVTYFDGLGRPMQSICIKQSGITGKDIITHIDYDAFGRQAKDYLPYVPSIAGEDGSYRTDALGLTNSFYDKTNYETDFPGMTTLTINPYSEKLFEASPLNRVLEQTAPGNSWKAGIIFDSNGHTDGNTIKFGNQTNIISEVRLYNITLAFANNTYTPILQNTTPYYAASQLYKTIIKDENWKTVDNLNKTTEEFKDKQGRIILKRTYNVGQKHDTYYVYDDFGNLTYVLPPKMEASTANIDTVNSQLNELGYQYKYDHRNRLIEKKTPGKGTATDWEEIVYNKLDQPILTRDPNLKAQGRWLFTKYDVFGRVAYTGLITNGNSRAILQTAADATISIFVIKNTLPTTIVGTTIYYDNGAYPIIAATDEIQTINYYDDYNFGVPAIPVNRNYTDPITTRTKGLATGSKVKVLGQTNNWITTTTYYDEKARPIYVNSTNEYLGTTDIIESELDFVGKADEVTATHSKTGQAADIVTKDTFVYDHAGRLLEQSQDIIINNVIVNEETIVANTYDELGQLISKGVGNTETTPLQTVNYAYNIRGWLKQINDPNILGTDLFGFKINYNTTEISGSIPLYNGNISEAIWKTKNDEASSTPWINRAYSYQYDPLNRIIKGDYKIRNSSGVFVSSNYTEYSLSNVTYDKNGNIGTLRRYTNSGYYPMDDLTYSYDTGNKLLKVVDNGYYTVKDQGFKDGTNTGNDYTYDANGNMLKDLNKAMTSNILYNHLNLPTKVTFASGNIAYIYDATGVKLEKVVTEGVNITRTKYAGNFIYEKIGTAADVLKFFNTAEGYVEPNGGTGYNYVYQYKDHLGNIRLSYKDISITSTPSLQIVEENNYYPFGLKHKGYNSNVSAGVNSVAQKFKYNGVELEESLGLNLYEMEFRQYDAAIARFTGIDPVTHHGLSPYMAFDGNPVFYSDPSGADSESNTQGAATDMWGRARYDKWGGYIPPYSRGEKSNDFGFFDPIGGNNNVEENDGKGREQQETPPFPQKIDFKGSDKEIMNQFIIWFNYVDKYASMVDIYPEDIIDYKSEKSQGFTDARNWTTTGSSNKGGLFKDGGGTVRLRFIVQLKEKTKYDPWRISQTSTPDYPENGYKQSDSNKEYIFKIIMQDGGTAIFMNISGKDLRNRIYNAIRNGGFFQIKELKN